MHLYQCHTMKLQDACYSQVVKGCFSLLAEQSEVARTLAACHPATLSRLLEPAVWRAVPAAPSRPPRGSQASATTLARVCLVVPALPCCCFWQMWPSAFCCPALPPACVAHTPQVAAQGLPHHSREWRVRGHPPPNLESMWHQGGKVRWQHVQQPVVMFRCTCSVLVCVASTTDGSGCMTNPYHTPSQIGNRMMGYVSSPTR